MLSGPTPKRYRRGGADHFEHVAQRPAGPTNLADICNLPKSILKRLLDVERKGGADLVTDL